MGVRRTASILVASLVVLLLAGLSAASAGECLYDISQGEIVCNESGSSNEGPTESGSATGKRYLHVTTLAGIGECHYWSNTPGGFDSWSSLNDAMIIDAIFRTPECPAISAVNARATAWSIFRSWPLAAPQPAIEPDGIGITGLPSYLSASTPTAITHTEVLPDGRTLRVRADAVLLTVSWGDGTAATFAPDRALAYPAGEVRHTYSLKTCTAEYRAAHPSGGLCHPSLDHYEITATFTWSGSYNVGSDWIDLGTLTRTASLSYEVNEARGIVVR